MLPCCLLGSVELNLVFDCSNYPQFKLMAHSLFSFCQKALTPFPTEWAYCYCMCHFIKIRVSPKSFLGSKCGKNDERGKETQMQEASHMWCKGTGKASPSCPTSAAHLGAQCSCHLLQEASLGLIPLDIAFIRVHQQNRTHKRQTTMIARNRQRIGRSRENSAERQPIDDRQRQMKDGWIERKDRY